MTLIKCIECEAVINVPPTAEFGEIIVCSDCGVDLELAEEKKDGREIVIFQLAPQEAEDWGE